MDVGTRAEDPKHFAAFISYRHREPDKLIAKRLHWLLEHNPVRPRRGLPRRIRPVFRDAEELPLTSDLTGNLKAALSNSDCLFVVCSPALKESKYCLEEIRYFKQVHDGRLDRVFSILVEGEPDESFPEELRWEKRRRVDESGHVVEEKVPVEPLFADVRAKTLRQSLRILRKREYLRLAAGYFGCSYDQLYKRRRRWAVRVALMAAAVTLSLSLGFTLYSRHQQAEYARAKAETYAAYAEEQAQGGDEALAMTLGLEAWDEAKLSGDVRLPVALRSAWVQRQYKLGAMPAAPVMIARYERADGTVYYLGRGERHMLIADVDQEAGFALFDTQTGMRLTNYAFDRIFVAKNEHSLVVSVGARTGTDNVTRDYFAVYSLPDNVKLGEYAFRESTGAAPGYTLDGYKGLNILKDGGEPVAYFDSQGSELDKATFAKRLLDLAAQPQTEEQPPFQVELKRSILPKEKGRAVVDREGEALLRLNPNGATAFSPDYAFFACENSGTIDVYQTGTWEKVASVSVGDEAVWRVDLYRQPGFLSVSQPKGGENVTTLFDWNTGGVLARFEGFPVHGQQDDSVYAVRDGAFVRYHYNASMLGEKSAVVSQNGAICLLAGDRSVSLLDADSGAVLLRAECEDPASVRFSADLQRILIPQAEGVVLMSGLDASTVWATGAPADAVAMSADGECAAWLDGDAAVHVLRGTDGSELYTVEAGAYGAGDVEALAVSQEGLLVATGDGALWFTNGGGEAVPLGAFTRGEITSDGLILLEAPDAYARDFAVFRAADGALMYIPEDNTGAFAYSPESGLLVRQRATSGDHATYDLEVLKREGNAFRAVGALLIPENEAELYLDRTGRMLTVQSDGGTRVYDLATYGCLLDASGCTLRYENGKLYACEAAGDLLFRCEFLDGDALEARAEAEITSPLGRRTLSDEENRKYSFSDR